MSQQSTIIYHSHHLIPRFRIKKWYEAGHLNDQEYKNLMKTTIKVSKEEHIEIHQAWYDIFKNSNDLRAANWTRGNFSMSGENNPNYGNYPSPEQKKKHSQWMKNYLQNNPNPMQGKTHSEKTKQEMSQKRKEWMKRNKHPLEGIGHSEETKEKIRKQKIGLKQTEEQQRKKSASLKEYYKHNPKDGKSVKDHKGNIFKSATECANYYNIPKSTLLYRINHKVTKDGFHFQYI